MPHPCPNLDPNPYFHSYHQAHPHLHPHPHLDPHANNFLAHSPRMCEFTLNTNPHPITIFSIYAPSQVEDPEEDQTRKSPSWSELDIILSDHPNSSHVLLLGDIFARLDSYIDVEQAAKSICKTVAKLKHHKENLQKICKTEKPKKNLQKICKTENKKTEKKAAKSVCKNSAKNLQKY